MRKTNLFRFLSAAAVTAAMSVLVVSCHKKTDDSLGSDDNGGYASDHVKMENISNGDLAIADNAAATGSGAGLRTTSACATVTRTVSGSDSVLTIDFGTTNCTCADGKNRRGKIIVTYSGHYKDEGSTHTITYIDYYIQDNQLTGTKTVTNMGMNSSSQYYYNVTVDETLNLGTGNGEIHWVGNRTRTWLTGYSTPDKTDDSYLISGTTSLTRANGKTFTMTITSPLQVAWGCSWIEKGTVSIANTLGATRTLDYGDGNCDSQATLTIGTRTYNITLK